MRIVITGANRGIGLELVKQCVARGDSVIAGVRDPGKATDLSSLQKKHSSSLTVLALDVSNDSSVREFASQVKGPVDGLINNAGVMGKTQDLEKIDFEDALRTFSINALGPLRVTRALLPNLREGQGKKVLHITSGMGSIGDNDSGGYYGYRMSKAALNMASRSLAADLRGEGILSAVINPGWVQTDMGGRGAPTNVTESVTGILKQFDSMTQEQSGEFLDHQGKSWPW
jgi:NAD(P)-dependent dehydrogenase (short-subunit alcohol dehydrogenase family)